MADVESIVESMRRNPVGITFSDLCKVCEHYFGAHRMRGSHRIYKTPWMGDPRVNIQDEKGRAKSYQVRQVLQAIEKLSRQAEAEVGDKN